MGSDLAIFLVFLAGLLAVVAVMGHGIWVFVAWFIRQLVGTPAETASKSPRVVVSEDLRSSQRVGQEPRAEQERVASTTPQPRATFESTKRHLARLRDQGLIDDTIYGAVVRGLDRERAAQAGPSEPDDIVTADIVAEAKLPGPAETTDAPSGPPSTASPAGSPPPPTAPPERRSLAQRVQHYAARRQAAAVAASGPAEREPAKTPRRTVGQLLATFMEEKNIRWGELVGGLLIVSCSVALVVSFWAQISERPLLKFGIFNGVTAALFGLGLHAWRRWKLPTTSQGLLTTATLLAPLNFLAIAAFSRVAPAASMPALAGELLSIVGFAALIYFAGRIVVPTRPLALAVGIIAPSTAQLVVRRLVEPTTGVATVHAIGVVVALVYIAVNAVLARDAAKHGPLTERRANELFELLGLTTFATLLPLGLMAVKTEQIAWALRYLAPIVSSMGIPALATGLLLWQRTDRPETSALRTAGTSVAAAGALILLVGIAVAWPQPAILLPTSLAVFAVLAVVAMALRIPEAHLPAAVCLALAHLLLCHTLAGGLDWWVGGASDTVGALCSAFSGQALVGFAAVYAAVAAVSSRLKRARDTLWLLLCSLVAAVCSLLLITVYGFGVAGDPAGVTWVYLLYALALLGSAWFIQRSALAWGGGALLLLATAQAVVYRWAGPLELEQPWIVALLVHATAVAAGAVGTCVASKNRWRELAVPLIGWALAGSAAAVGLMGWQMTGGAVTSQAPYFFWLSGIWLAIACISSWPSLFTGFQVALTVALVLAVQGRIELADWYGSLHHGWYDPWSLQAQGVALGLLCLAFTAVRIVLRGFFGVAEAGPGESQRGTTGILDELRKSLSLASASPAGQGGHPDQRPIAVRAIDGPSAPTWREVAGRLLYPQWISFDRLVTAGVVVLLLGLATCGVVPGIAQELSPRASQVRGTATSVDVGSPRRREKGPGTTALATQDAPAFWQPTAASNGRGRPSYHGTVATPETEVDTPVDRPGPVARQVRVADRFEWLGIDHQHALQGGSWTLLAVTLLLLAAGRWQQRRNWQLVGIVLVVASACLLLATRWEPQVSVASALRWYTAATFAVGSLCLWVAKPVLHATGLGQRVPATQGNAGTPPTAFALLVLITVTPLVAMGAFVAGTAVSLRPPDAAQQQLMIWLALVFAVCAVAAVAVGRLDRRPDKADGVPVATGWPVWRHASGLLLVLSAAPLLVVTLLVVAAALARHPIVGPEPNSFFARIGLSVSYAVPILLIAASLVGHAVHRRSAGLALLAGLVINAGATAAYLLAPAGIGQLPIVQWIRVAQVNAIVSAGYTLLWWLARHRTARAEQGRIDPQHPLITQMGLSAGFLVLLIVPATLVLAINPQPPAWLCQAAGPWGWVALGLVAAAGLGLVRVASGPARLGLLGGGLTAAASMIGLESVRWDVGQWQAYHTLMATHFVAASLVLTVGWRSAGSGTWVGSIRAASKRWPAWETIARGLGWQPLESEAAIASQWQAVTWWAAAITAIVGGLSLRALDGDPTMPWWPVSGLIGTAVLSTMLACWAGRQRFLYAASLLLSLAASAWWLSKGQAWLGSSSQPAALLELVQINIVALALPAVPWAWLDLRVLSRDRPLTQRRGLAVHRVAPAVSLVLLVLLTLLGLAADAVAAPVTPHAWIGWLALAATVAGVAACLWDRRARRAVAGLYVAGLAGLGMMTDQFNLPAEQLIWTGALLLGAYGLGTSYLWSRRGGLERLAGQLRMPPRELADTTGPGSLVLANFGLALIVVALGFWSQLTFGQFPLRLSAAQAVVVQAFAVGLLARGQRQSQLQATALWLGVAGAIAFAWAWLEPGGGQQLLNRSVLVAVALGGMAVLYGLGWTKLLRRENQWTAAARQLVPTLVALALVSIVLVLAVEVMQYTAVSHVLIAWPALVAVAVTLVGLCVACLVAALVPGRDPLGLSPRQKTVYVYAAEGMLALLFLHVRLTMPWLFTGFFQQYWPLIVMLIAYLGVGLSEWLRRSQQMILAEPLERTGALLPMLPVLGYWMVPGSVHYSLVMLVAGGLYTCLSVLRRSFGFGVLAALTANGGLWYLLYHADGLGVFEHPQLWLIPPALCVLVAAYLNRKRLTDEQMTTVRYLCSTVIYSSSTADVFLQGVAHAPWLPLVLAGLSLAGIFAGIMLRVRAFLFLGISFLVLALTTVIWHAAVDLQQTWLWFVSGIVAGVLIIALFAVFEKKRQEVVQLVEHVKTWDA